MYYELLLDNQWLPPSYKNSKRTCIQLKFYCRQCFKTVKIDFNCVTSI